MTEPQRQRLIAEMAKLDGIAPEQVAAKFVIAPPIPTAGETPDLFSAPIVPEPATEPAEPATKPEITEHVTGRGKTLRGIVR